MKKLAQITMLAIGFSTIASGCMTASLATAENTSEKWDKFKSMRVVPYAGLGVPTIDGIGKEVTALTGTYVDQVVKPMIEADKEGYTGMVAQFEEDVEEARKDGKTENDVLRDWKDRYGSENIETLKRAFSFVRQQQNGKNAMAEIAVKRLPEYVKLSSRMPAVIDEVKSSTSNPIQAAKLVNAANQVGEQIENLIWSATFMKILHSDQAAETEALKAYVESFQSRVN